MTNLDFMRFGADHARRRYRLEQRALDAIDISDSRFYLLFNAHHEDVSFVLPPKDWGERWATVLDTSDARLDTGETYGPGDEIAAGARSLVVLEGSG